VWSNKRSILFCIAGPKNVPFLELIQGDEVGLPKQTAKQKTFFKPVRNESRTYSLPIVFIQLPDVVDVRPFRSLYAKGEEKDLHFGHQEGSNASSFLL
jgi:hypothetical protein